MLSSKARVAAALFSRHSWWATSIVRPYSTRSNFSRAFASPSRLGLRADFASPSRASSAPARAVTAARHCQSGRTSQPAEQQRQQP